MDSSLGIDGKRAEPATARSKLTLLAGGVRLATGFLLGQGAVQALTLLVSMLLLRVLSIEQYALYTVAGTLLALVSVGANPGLSQAIVSLGAARQHDKPYVGGLLSAARRMSRWLMIPAIIVVIILAIFLLRGQQRPLTSEIACVGLVFLIGFAQVETSLARAVLNMHHDARSTFRVGFTEAGLRLLLLPIAVLWPTAAIALVANLAGAIAASVLTAHRSGELCDRSAAGDTTQTSQLVSFIAPIAPMVIYTLAQGQIAILLLSVFAEPRAIAETGALSRLGQIFTVLMLLNPFLIQPIFARIQTRSDFVAKTSIVIGALSMLCAVCIASTYFVPDWWLLILGDNYSGLSRELPVSVAASLATIFGGTLYTMIIARGSTRWQSTAILPCLGGQLVFIAFNGVRTTWDALMLGLIPAVAYALVQVLLLAALIRRGSLGNLVFAD